MMKLKLIVFAFWITNLFAIELDLKNYKKIESSIKPIESSLIKNKISSKSTQSATAQSNTSLNWAGYVAANNIQDPRTNSVKAVAGSWVVPVLYPLENSSCVIWLGMDGYKGQTIEQIGTAHEFVNGTQTNYAWFAVHPNNSFQIGNFPINLNDSISALVTYFGGNQFTLTIANNTTQEFTTVPLRLTAIPNALRNTAQWIVEADSRSLAKFNTISFGNCSAIINNKIQKINDLSNSAVTMVLATNVAANPNNRFNKNTAKAVPTKLSSTGTSFKVHWYHK